MKKTCEKAGMRKAMAVASKPTAYAKATKPPKGLSRK
jgi:hypothetical protein